MNSKNYLTVFLLLSVSAIFSQIEKLAFIQNKGQWDAGVIYKTDFPGGQAQATPTGMLVGIFDPNSLQARAEWGMKIEEREGGAQYKLDHPEVPGLKGHGWRFHFLYGNATPVIESSGINPDFYNFWVGDPAHHASKVRSFEQITYKNVYPDIDVKYYTSEDGYLENDIIIKPMADFSHLLFEIEGIDDLTQNIDGDLVLSTSLGDVVIPAPVSYLMDNNGKKTPIHISYTLLNKTVGFVIPNYDNSQTLVIDPVIVRWATWATNSSSSDTHNHATGLDAAGNIFVTGRITTTGLITVGAFQTTSGGSTDIFVGKYTEPTSPGGSGSRVWQTFLGGTQVENNIALQMGTDGYIYIAGNTSSDNPKTYGTGFTAGGWTQRTASSGAFTQVFIIKLDAAGNGALTREIGSVTADFNYQPSDIRILKTGTSTYDLVLSGYFTPPTNQAAADGDYPAPLSPAGTAANKSNATLNGLVMRITSDFATIAWIKNFGSDVSGAKTDAITISAVDIAGNVFVAGYTNASTNISYNNPSSQTTIGGSQDGWIMKLNSSGVVQWSRYFKSGSGKTSSILSMEVTQADTNLIIAGITSGLNASNITAGVVQSTYGGGSFDLFVSMISKSGIATNWGTYYGGSGTETNMMGLNMDDNDDIYFLGYSSSTNYPTASNPLQNTRFGSNDAVFTKLNSTGTTTMYSTYFGGTADDNDPIGQRGILFKNCRIYLSVTAASNDMPLTNGAITTTKTSSTSIPEPLIVSMANPPDLNGNSITTNQTVGCHGTPTTFSAGVATYNIPSIIRNGTVATNGTANAYPSGVPAPAGYQWQMSTDYTNSWTNISGATGQNYSPGSIVETTQFRRIISGDYCTVPDSVVTVVVSGGPNVFPSATCASTTISLFANPTGGSGSNTYVWSGPLSFSSTLQNPQVTSASSANNGNYKVIVTDAGGCKNTKVMYVDFSSCTYSIILSVKLINFDAVKTGSHVNVDWQTANEQNSENFDIERSNNGTTWIKIGTVNAAGKSTKILEYNFLDEYPAEGANFYRLRSNETTGKYGYSQVKKVLFDAQTGISIVNVMPNPFENTLTVNYSSPGNNTITLKIMDAIGRTIATKETNALKGINTIQFNTVEYATGLYFITIIYNDITSSYKMLVKE